MHALFCFLSLQMPRQKSKLPYVVHSSGIHGNGVFAKKLIRKGTRIIEYRGIRSTIDVERQKPVNDPRNPHHTFLFGVNGVRPAELHKDVFAERRQVRRHCAKVSPGWQPDGSAWKRSERNARRLLQGRTNETESQDRRRVRAPLPFSGLCSEP